MTYGEVVVAEKWSLRMVKGVFITDSYHKPQKMEKQKAASYYAQKIKDYFSKKDHK